MGKTMIEVDQLVRRYGERVAVDRISFRVAAGEIVGLLGPNGAGKTTTMRVLTGFLPPTSGRVAIAGHDVVRDSLAARAQVGYLPERIPVYPEMTVRGYVKFWARLRGVRDNTLIDQALARVHLSDRASSLVRTLSKGMRQRIGFAQALVHQPSVIILDEPTIGIDPEQVIDVRQTVRELGTDHAVLFSTHILSEAEQVCDRIIIIHQGVTIAQGKLNDLRSAKESLEALYLRLVSEASEKERRRR